jgi:hypothetical protein
MPLSFGANEAPLMARMTRELSFVLLGAGLLTSGYFLWPEEDPLEVANKQAAQGGGGGAPSRPAHVHHVFLSYGGRPAARASSITARGGFGRTGAGVSGG